MNKVGKRFLSACLALSVICGIGGISVFAASSASGSINGYDTSGVSSISYTGASAYTSFETNGDVSVRATYTYINYNTIHIRVKDTIITQMLVSLLQAIVVARR